MSPGVQLLIGLGLATGLILLLFAWQWWTRNATSVDVGWSGGLGLLALFYLYSGGGEITARQLVIGWLAALWAFRLAAYLGWTRVLRHKEEDGRYQELRRSWGAANQLWFFGFYLLQALACWLFSLPVFIALQSTSAELTVWDWLGAAILLISVFGEAIADWQLADFRAHSAHRGQTCRIGLWRYSRHPNYFFEWLHWWSYVVWSIGSPWGWTTLFGPALMLLFLFRITGIPATEAQALRSRGDDYRDYQRTTSVFVPWFPSKGRS